MFPRSDVPVPKVAELPTCQATPQLEALLERSTEEPLAVVSVVPIWKIKMESGLFNPFKVRVPVN
jgi:hypothetical protein